MFKTTNRNGFHVAFDNGYTVSVQWGDGNYCSPRGTDFRTDAPPKEAHQVEVAAWSSTGDWVKLSDNDDVIGWQSADDVLAIMTRIAALPAA